MIITRNKHKRINFEYIDIRELFDDLGIQYSEQGKNISKKGWIGLCCPFCDDTSNHLGVHLKSGVISCYKCGTKGTVLKYLVEILGSYSKAYAALNNHMPRELRIINEDISENIETNTITNVELPIESSTKITPYHAGYLNSRGFDYKYLTEKYKLRFCGPTGKWKNRIIVPIYSKYKLVTFTSIDISDETLSRYKHLEDEKSIIPIKQYLYGLKWVKHDVICLVEGLFDMFRLGDGAICTFGVKLTDKQKQLVSKFRRVYIAFDGDSPGEINAAKLALEIAPFTETIILELPKGKDPDTLDKGDIQYIQQKIN